MQCIYTKVCEYMYIIKRYTYERSIDPFFLEIYVKQTKTCFERSCSSNRNDENRLDSIPKMLKSQSKIGF